MCDIKLHVRLRSSSRAPIDRHPRANVNEYSARSRCLEPLLVWCDTYEHYEEMLNETAQRHHARLPSARRGGLARMNLCELLYPVGAGKPISTTFMHLVEKHADAHARDSRTPTCSPTFSSAGAAAHLRGVHHVFSAGGSRRRRSRWRLLAGGERRAASYGNLCAEWRELMQYRSLSPGERSIQ